MSPAPAGHRLPASSASLRPGDGRELRPASPPHRPATLLGASRAQAWRRVRVPLAIACLLLVVASVSAFLVSRGSRGFLDPRAADPAGSHALAVLLGQDGVDVRRESQVNGLAARLGADDTVLIALPDRLDRRTARELVATGADLVLVAASRPEDWVDAVTVRRGGADQTDDSPDQFYTEPDPEPARTPACALPAAVSAGSAEVAEISYSASRPPGGDAVLCYADDGLAALVVLTDGDGRRVTFLGDSRPLTNDRLDDAGNAALALGLLRADGPLVWLLPPLTAGSPRQCRRRDGRGRGPVLHRTQSRARTHARLQPACRRRGGVR